MIEAILWRHRYPENHPQEQAVIVTTGRGNRILLRHDRFYSQGGRVYGSSNALGERFPIKGLTPADLGTAAGTSRATKAIGAGIRKSLRGWRPSSGQAGDWR